MEQHLSLTDYTDILAQSQVLFSGKRGPRLLATQDDHIIKLFPQRKWLSSNRLRPYAKRFVHNASRLAQLGIASIQTKRFGKILGTTTHFVEYQKIPGQDIREQLQNGAAISLLNEIAQFVGKLHQQGVFFRGIHLGNILQQSDGRFALIDITNMSFKSKALPLRYRQRNLLHLLRYQEDKAIFDAYGIMRFLAYYFQSAGLTQQQQQWLQQQV